MPCFSLRKRAVAPPDNERPQSPSSSTCGQPCAASTATGASEPAEKVPGRIHRAAARGDLAWLRRWRWYLKAVGIDRRDREGRTPLHLASANGHAEVVRYLLRKNGQLNLADNLQRTPLMKAVQCQQEECVAVLLAHGADPNLADADGNTALHLAVLSASTTIPGLLLKHNANSDAQNQEGYTPLDLAASEEHQEMLESPLRKAADRPAQDERTAVVVVTTGREASLQKELDRDEAQLQEEEEKSLQADECVHDTNTAPELQEQVQRLESENARLEATVQQQSERIEALQRDLQASASQLDTESKRCQQLHEQNQVLQEQLRTLRGKCKNLQKSQAQLEEEVAKLQHHLETDVVDRKELQQYKRELEEQANREMEQKLEEVGRFLQAQEAFQDKVRQIRASLHQREVNQLKDKIRDFEDEVDCMRSAQKDRDLPSRLMQAEAERYKELYLQEVKSRRCLAVELERAKARLAEADVELLWEHHRSNSLMTNGHPAASPVLESSRLGHHGDSLGLNRNLGVGGSFLSPTESRLANMRADVEARVATVRRELEEQFARDLQRATAGRGGGSAGCSKYLHMDQDPLRRLIEEHRAALTGSCHI